MAAFARHPAQHPVVAQTGFPRSAVLVVGPSTCALPTSLSPAKPSAPSQFLPRMPAKDITPGLTLEGSCWEADAAQKILKNAGRGHTRLTPEHPGSPFVQTAVSLSVHPFRSDESGVNSPGLAWRADSKGF